jgi:hypothetical protein
MASCWLKLLHPIIKKSRAVAPIFWLAYGEAFSYSHLAILLKTETSAVKQTERAAPFEEEERLVLQKSVHPFYHWFDLTFVVLLCLENFREYFIFCI